LTEPRRNVELKARDAHPERSLATCGALGAKAEGVLVQRDTYFHTREGRLKLREEQDATAQLIAYERADLCGQRTSHYRLIDVGEPEELKAALATTLGVEVVVAKERRLFLWDSSVRIHLDTVEGLGEFIEFEAVAPGDSDLGREEAQVERLRAAFEIDDADVIGASYCDLTLSAKAGVGVEPSSEQGERLER
jgi:adenylate cyclase, class 2